MEGGGEGRGRREGTKIQGEEAGRDGGHRDGER